MVQKAASAGLLSIYKLTCLFPPHHIILDFADFFCALFMGSIIDRQIDTGTKR
jgi:hypothetical protein